ncbi:MAG: hypothetical protein JRG76_13970 [Deltaproteobacteria bacterium]|nr:hypothetical protein [Deltaproteobacteria bacterium]
MRGPRRSLLSILALVAACGAGTPIPDVPLRITAGAPEVELGKAFPLTVVRTWSRGQTPADWNDEALAPLDVRLLETSRREDEQRVEETRRYVGYAFSLADVRVPGLELRVKRALDPATPGPAELPGEPLPEPYPWSMWAAVGAALLTAFVLLLRRRRRPATVAAPAPASEPPPPGPHELALERLARLRRQQPQGHEQISAYYVEASGLVRDYVGERFAVQADVMTTEELVELEAPLARVLPACDLVKFARHAPSASEREQLLDRAEAFVRETT